MISGMLQAGVRRLRVVSEAFLFTGSLPPYIAAVRYSARRSTLILIAMELPSGLMEAGQFNRISRALADPRRMEILERIAGDKEVACAAVASESPVSQPTISHHLKELATAGLIKPRREAKFCFYHLDRKIWAAYLAEMRRRIPISRRRN